MRVHRLACVIAAMGAVAAPACPDQGCEAYQARTFFGYDCDLDCGPEKAGFAWAERHGIASPGDCVAAGPALEPGCRAYASERLSPFEAGYAWALENEVADPGLCNGGGVGFRLGCLGYAEEVPARAGSPRRRSGASSACTGDCSRSVW